MSSPSRRRRRSPRSHAVHLSCLSGAALCLLGGVGVLHAQSPASLLGTPEPKVHRLDAARAEQAYLEGAKLVDRGDYASAQTEFSDARAMNPLRPEYAEAFELAREGRVNVLIRQAAEARLAGRPGAAAAFLAEAKAVDPNSDEVREHLPEPAAALPAFQQVPTRDLQFAPPLQAAPLPGPRDFDLRGDPRQVTQQVVEAFGLKAVFDDSVTGGQPIRFTLQGSDYVQTLNVLMRMNHLFATVLDPKTLLIAKDTQENRQRLERQAEETIYVPGSTPEQLNELQNIVKSVFDVQKVSVQPNSSALVVRAPEPTLKAVNFTLADLIDGGAQVMLEVKLLSVDKTHTVNTGLSTPTSINAFSIASEAQTIVAANQSLIQTAIQQGLFTPTGNAAQDILLEALYLIRSGLATDANVANLIGLVGGGLTTAGISLGSAATVNLALNSSDVRALDDVTLRAGDKQTTTLRIGSKYPITTSTYSSGVSASAASALAGVTVNGQSASALLSQYLGTGSTTVIPQIQYEDLGITLKTTPTVLKDGMISVAVDLKIEALTGSSNNNIPILTSRVFTSSLTVPEGDTALMTSEVSNTESKAISGLPGLASLPGFQASLADTARERDSSELVLLITPHVIRRRSGELASPRIAFQTSVPQEY